MTPIFGLAVAGLVFSASMTAQEGDLNSGYKVYPWAEESTTVRLDKRLVKELPVRLLGKTNSATVPFVLTESFITIFRLTPGEIQQVTSAINNAVHEYRTAEAAHCEPAPEPAAPIEPVREPAAPIGRGEPVVEEGERFTFRVKPFPEQAAAIRARLEKSILATLGAERAEVFWKNEAPMIDLAMRQGRKEQGPPEAGETWTRTYTFVLPVRHPGRVDLVTRDEWKGPGAGRGSGRESSTFPEALDPYAPESMRPLIAAWRRNAPVAAANAVKPMARPDKTPVAGKVELVRWDEKANYVDVPKAIWSGWDVRGLSNDEELTPEIKALLSLGEEDAKAITDLYNELKRKFEKLEQANFHRAEPGKNSFVLRAFPEGAALKQEWAERLTKQVGRTRAELLNQSIQGKGRPEFFRPRARRGMAGGKMPVGGGINPGAPWISRGEEMQLDVTMEQADGPPRMKIQYKTGAGGGTLTTPLGQIPKHWQHLLTVEMLGLPLAL
jgi:hypothetical protein